MKRHFDFVQESDPGSLPAKRTDPSPLDDKLASYTVNIMSQFINDIAQKDDIDRQFLYYPSWNPLLDDYSLTNNSTLSNTIISDTYREASRIIFYVSASNWPIVFGHIKRGLRLISSSNTNLSLSSTPSPASGSTGASTSIHHNNIYDVRFLTCVSLNAHRLSMVLTELCAVFLQIKRSAQLTIAVLMRRAIWNWIDTYPSEFQQLQRGKSRLPGGPEILFDICDSLSDTQRRKAVFWTLQSMLLILCPDVVSSTADSVSLGSENKKTLFLNNLYNGIRGSHVADLAAVCYIDILVAGSHAPFEDDVAIRQVIPDVYDILKENLFNISTPLLFEKFENHLSSDTAVDPPSIVAGAIVGLFLSNPHDTVDLLLSIWREDNASDLFKKATVKACFALSYKFQSIPNRPSSSLLYNTLSTPIRRMFLYETYVAYSQDAHKNKIVSEEIREQHKFLLRILCLYRADPKLAIMGPDNDRVEQNGEVLLALTQCMKLSSDLVRSTARNCLSKLHEPENILEWGPKHCVMDTFWTISSKVTFHVAKQLVETTLDIRVLKKRVAMLKLLLTSRTTFLLEHQEADLYSHNGDVREHLQCMIGLETVLLILLCSPYMDMCSAASECVAIVCNELTISTHTDESSISSLALNENFPIYGEIGKLGKMTGQKLQQKQIRKFLRGVTYCTPGNMAAWEEIFRRWKNLTPVILGTLESVAKDNLQVANEKREKSRTHHHHHDRKKKDTFHASMSPADRAIFTEWQNYGGFLASLCGICLFVETSSSPHLISVPTVSQPELQRNPRTASDAEEMVNQFIYSMTELLICDDPIICDWATETLGTDLSPALYYLLFRHLFNMITRYLTPEGRKNTLSVVAVERSITILRLVLNRVEGTENLLTVDIAGLVSRNVEFLKDLGPNSDYSWVKIKMCRLCEVMMEQKERLTLRREFRLRNRLLEYMTEWTSDRNHGNVVLSMSVPVEQSQRDLDLACLRAIASLLEHLPLQPWEAVYDMDMSTVKRDLFYKYFTFFLSLLNRCRAAELTSDDTTVILTKHSRNRNEAAYLTSLKTGAILGLSNLLSANIDIGLQYSLSMSYHEDMSTRAAIMQVLTNVINQGTEFETLEETLITDRYEKLVDMFIEFDLNFVFSLCASSTSSDFDSVINLLLTSFASRGKALDLLNAAIIKEVQTTASETDLFRKTSVTTRLLSIFTKRTAGDYLRSVLMPAFEKIINQPEEMNCFEVDPSITSFDVEETRNRDNVIRAANIFLSAICASAPDAPRSFKEICSYISKAVGERFPEATCTAVGAFVFLRFFCPAIVTPDVEELIKHKDKISGNLRRGFLIITKIIQNLANNVLFGAKETYMIVFNEFLTTNFYRVTKFLHELSTVPADESYVDDMHVVMPMSERQYKLLHKLLAENIEQMGREAASYRLRQLRDNETLSAWKRDFDKFATLLAELGSPPDISSHDIDDPQLHTYTASNQLYAEFMQRNSRRSVDTMLAKNIFYKGNNSKSGRSVFYFICRYVNAESIDYELLIYFVLQTIKPVASKPFDVVIDTTQFCPVNDIPNQWLTKFTQLCPIDTIRNLSQIIVYNPNTYLQKYLKRVMTTHTWRTFRKRVTFVTSLNEMNEFISPSEVRLPTSTVKIDADSCSVYLPVYQMSANNKSMATTLRVGKEYIQLISMHKQEVMENLSAIINDVFHVSEISSVYLLHNSRGNKSPTAGSSKQPLLSRHLFELCIKYNQDMKHLVLSSHQCDAIVAEIRQNKKEHDLLQPSSITTQPLRPADVPGRLLSISLINCGNDDPSLRLASYRLLYSLISSFKYDIECQMVNVKDLGVPANSTHFIVTVSQEMAKSAPELTLEVLNECLTAFKNSDNAARYLSVLVMVPWLPNLAACSQSNLDDQTKVKAFINKVINLTISRDLYKLIQSQLWRGICRVYEIVPFVLNVFVQYSVERGVGSIEAEMIADTIVTVSSQFVRGKIVSRLRRTLIATSLEPTKSLTRHPLWREIATLIRLVDMASFNNQGPLKHYIPEVLHITSLVAGIGPSLICASVHALIVNLVQSICLAMPLPEANINQLNLLMTELSNAKHRCLFGLNKPNINAFTITPETLTDTVDGRLDLHQVQTVVNMSINIIRLGSPNTDVQNMWCARWMSLVVSTAFRTNPAVQPRALIALGCLAREKVDDDLVYQILSTLRTALDQYEESEPDLVLSIIMCLKNIIESFQRNTRYLLPLFWVAIALTEINSAATFTMSVELVQAVLRALDARGVFAGQPMTDVLLAARIPLMEPADLLDSSSGVRFNVYFSFAVATVFFKGWRHANAKATICNGLNTFLDIECRQSQNNIFAPHTLGYVVAQLPTMSRADTFRGLFCHVDDAPWDRGKSTPIEEIISPVGSSTLTGSRQPTPNDQIKYILDRLNVSDDTAALLLVSLLLVELDSTDNDAESAFIYSFMADAVKTRPDMLYHVYDVLLPKMNQMVANTKSQTILRAVESILLTASLDPDKGTDRHQQQENKHRLEKIGFSALADPAFGALSPVSRLAKLAGQVVASLLAT